MRSSRKVVIVALMAVGLGFIIEDRVSGREQSGCSAVGIEGENIDCGGRCNDNNKLCAVKQGSLGGNNYQYCGCDGSTETACCHLIRFNTGEVYAVTGNCNIGQPGCQDQSLTCTLAGEGTVASQYFAQCTAEAGGQ